MKELQRSAASPTRNEASNTAHTRVRVPNFFEAAVGSTRPPPELSMEVPITANESQHHGDEAQGLPKLSEWMSDGRRIHSREASESHAVISNAERA